MSEKGSSKKLEMKRARREAKERQQKERARQARRKNLVTVAVAVIVLAVVAALALGSRPKSRDLPEASKAPEGVVSKEIEERNHVEEPVDYPDDPPMGGNHAPVWQNCGFYEEPIIKEQGVHSLEHGAAWITYQPDLAQTEKDALEEMARGQDFLLVTPYEGLKAPIVASAWGRQLEVESADDPKLAQFASFFQVGPQTPEPGAPCTGGTM